MHIPLNNLQIQHAHIAREIEHKLISVAKSGNYILGPEVDAFEREFAHVTQSQYCIGVASGTDGLLLALKALGIQQGDEVLTVSYSFIATALAITYAGATPIFVDIDPKTYLIQPRLIEEKITKRTKAILPVALYGQPPDLTFIYQLAKKHKLKVILDACQSHGATYGGKQQGIYCDAVIYSFYPTKNLGAYGDGGAITVNSKKIWNYIRLLRNVGRGKWYDHIVKGYNSRLDNLQAAILRIKLRHLQKLNAIRQKKALHYNRLLSKTLLTLPYVGRYATSVYYLYVVRTKKRDALMKYLANHNITTAVHYPIPIHLQKAYKELHYKKGTLPETEKAAKEVLSLPFHAYITANEQEIVASTIKKFFRS